jgi:hypothetical protein
MAFAISTPFVFSVAWRHLGVSKNRRCRQCREDATAKHHLHVDGVNHVSHGWNSFGELFGRVYEVADRSVESVKRPMSDRVAFSGGMFVQCFIDALGICA